jgi:hypothetical protein
MKLPRNRSIMNDETVGHTAEVAVLKWHLSRGYPRSSSGAASCHTDTGSQLNGTGGWNNYCLSAAIFRDVLWHVPLSWIRAGKPLRSCNSANIDTETAWLLFRFKYRSFKLVFLSLPIIIPRYLTNKLHGAEPFLRSRQSLTYSATSPNILWSL